MDATKFYSLPPLRYRYDELTPAISEAQLTLHHQKHHQAYVNGANAILERLDKTRKEGADFDAKATFRELSFHVGGHILHSLFWENMAPAGVGGGVPEGTLERHINEEYGSFDRFKREFTQVAASVEGSGWAALTLCRKTMRPMLMQVEKHNVNVYPGFTVLMVLDLWEHAYYLDYRNDRAKFIEAFFTVVNWDTVNSRLEAALTG